MDGEGNDNPLQCSCLENPRDGAAWWAAVYGVAQSQTRLKQPSSSSSSHMERNEKECPRDQNMGINIGLYIVRKNLQSRPSVEY